jgi:hypothetical protein
MPRSRPKRTLERSASADLFKHTLSKIPTVFGQLAYLASLRDQNSGIYRHYGLSAAFGRDQSTRALEENHERVFLEWLNLPLAGKHADLKEFLAGLEDPAEAAVQHWLTSRVYRSWVPPGASKAEKRLFRHDLEILLEAAQYRSERSGTAQSWDGSPG